MVSRSIAETQFVKQRYYVLYLQEIALAFVTVIKLLSQLVVLILQNLQGLSLHTISFFKLLTEKIQTVTSSRNSNRSCRQHFISAQLRIYSHFLAQTVSFLRFCAKLLFGYIQIFLVLGILFLQFFELEQCLQNNYYCI